VSVVIPAFQAEEFIVEAIASVLDQDHRPLEVVVVDDGSTDRTAALVAGLARDEIRYAHQENRGAAAALNAGVRLARGEWISVLNADDVWTPGRLALQVRLADEHPEAEIVLGHLRRMWRPAGEPTWRLTEPELALSLQSCLARPATLARVGPFDEGLRYCFDWDWFFRARELGVPFHTHPEVTNHYRRHDGNMSAEADANREAALVFARSVARRRASGAGGPLARLGPAG
jgi:glycosyltransferase involved in cell wall biosynthesis